MSQLPAPAALRLCSTADREAARLCVTFDLIPSATDYDLRVDGVTLLVGFTPGSFVGGFDPNTDHSFEARARGIGFQDSDFSTPLVAVTRPPTPPVPSRLPIDLQGWGVTLAWEVPDGWNGAAGATTRLLRDDGAGPAVIFESRGLTGRFVDTHYPRTGLKAYSLQVFVISATMGGPNVSARGPSIDVRGAINALVPAGVDAVAPGETLVPLNRSLRQIQRAGARLLGLPTR